MNKKKKSARPNWNLELVSWRENWNLWKNRKNKIIKIKKYEENTKLPTNWNVRRTVYIDETTNWNVELIRENKLNKKKRKSTNWNVKLNKKNKNQLTEICQTDKKKELTNKLWKEKQLTEMSN